MKGKYAESLVAFGEPVIYFNTGDKFSFPVVTVARNGQSKRADMEVHDVGVFKMEIKTDYVISFPFISKESTVNIGNTRIPLTARKVHILSISEDKICYEDVTGE